MCCVRITHLLLQDFRGWAKFDLQPFGHILLAGVPRAGRSDIIAALRRLLDPDSARMQPVLTDIRQAPTAGLSPDRPRSQQPALPNGASLLSTR
jgi:hypothetical protein